MSDISPIQTKPPAASSAVDATIVTFAVSDPEVLTALADFPEGQARTQFLVTALKVGVLSLKAARGSLDADTVRREGDRLMSELGERLNNWRSRFEERVTGSLSKYFDPGSGLFEARVERLVKEDGELSTVFRTQVRDSAQTLAALFEQFVGENSSLLKALDPSEDNKLVTQMRGTLDSVVQGLTVSIADQFSMDNPDGALRRFMRELTDKHGDLTRAMQTNMAEVVAEFSLDNEQGALKRLVNQVDATQKRLTDELSLDSEGSGLQRLHAILLDHQRQNAEAMTRLGAQVESAVQLLQGKREEAARSTRHGLEFEAALGVRLRELVLAQGDLVEDTGATTGGVDRCKVGDHVITIGPEKTAAGARIVIEAKESASYPLTKTLEEAELARRNRGAGVCVFVHSPKTAPEEIPSFRRYGNDLVVRWHPDDENTDVFLQAALMVAAALSVKASSHTKQDAASFARIDKAVGRLLKVVDDFEIIVTAANSTKNNADKILQRVDQMKGTISDETNALQAEFAKVKHRQEDAGE